MNRKILVLLIALLAMCLFAGAQAQTECESYLDYGKAVAELGDSEAMAADADILASRLLMRSKEPMTNLDEFAAITIVAGPQNHYTLQFSNVEDALKCMETLKADKNVIYVQQDSVMTVYERKELVSDDPATEEDLNTAEADPYLSWGAKDMGVDDLAASVKASGSITVAVVDTGVGYHPFINSRVKLNGVDFTDVTYKDGRHDVNGHGTHVSGTIVDLTQGLNVNILPVRVLGDDGSGANSGVCNGIRYAADSGAKIINMSLGGELFSPYECESEERDAINYAINKGVTIVVAAGNESTNTSGTQPACFDNVIVVSAIDSAYQAAYFTNFGHSVDVCAPGVAITSCSIMGGYTDYNGTSMASPHVAAIAAMVKLQNPGFSPARVENYIKAHCLDLGDEGWDETFGYGLPCFIGIGEKTEGDYSYKVNTDGAVITKYSGKDADVVIPEKLGGENVVSIDAYVFSQNEVIESLTVPGCVKEIGNFSFANCPNLKTVTFGEGVIRIGDSAFAGCAVLDSVKLPKTLKNLGGNAFMGCAALKSCELPSGIEAMGACAFAQSGITECTLPANLSGVPVRAYLECKDLQSVVIEEGIKRIDSFAFDGCTSLKTVSIPKSLTLIGMGAFRDCIFESIELPAVEALASGAFIYCNKLVSLELPETLTVMEDYAFIGCTSLEKLTIPRSLDYYGEELFDECEKLTLYGYTGSYCEEYAKEFEIPFESIGYQTLLTKLTLYSEDPIVSVPGQFVYYGDVYEYEPIEATMPLLDWTSTDKTVCEVVEHEYGYDSYTAFAMLAKGTCTVTGTAKDGSGLTISVDVIVGDNVVRNVRLNKNMLTLTVGDAAELTAVILPDTANKSVVWSSDNAAVATVDDKGAIKALSIGIATITVQSVEQPELYDMCVVTVVAQEPAKDEFTYRVLDDSTVAITGYNGSGKDISIPAVIDGLKVTQIDERAFYESKITSVTISEGIEVIGKKAFAHCEKLKSVSLPESLTMLDCEAFSDCDKLPKVKKISLRITNDANGFVFCPVFTPANTASDYTISLSSKKSATVKRYGLVTPKTDDYFALTVKAGDKKIKIGVSNGEPYAASKVTIDGKEERTLKMNKTLKLSYTVKPKTARVVALWSSSDSDIAEVDQNGIVTPIAPGTVKILLETDLGLTDFVMITVK